MGISDLIYAARARAKGISAQASDDFEREPGTDEEAHALAREKPPLEDEGDSAERGAPPGWKPKEETP
jgi:hypothetical protein